jgi:hypothetical protein
MEYRLAKQLKDKDAGFPEVTGCGCGGMVEAAELYCPTLSELIGACGQKLNYLLNNIHEWKASGINGEFGRGSTPEEAVAKLWLANGGGGGKSTHSR